MKLLQIFFECLTCMPCKATPLLTSDHKSDFGGIESMHCYPTGNRLSISEPHYIFCGTKSNTHNDFITIIYARTGFFEIQKYIHLYDNMNLSTEGKFEKLYEYFRLLNDNFIEIFK